MCILASFLKLVLPFNLLACSSNYPVQLEHTLTPAGPVASFKKKAEVENPLSSNVYMEISVHFCHDQLVQECEGRYHD